MNASQSRFNKTNQGEFSSSNLGKLTQTLKMKAHEVKVNLLQELNKVEDEKTFRTSDIRERKTTTANRIT